MTYRVGVTRDEPLATVGGCWTRGGRAGRLNGKTNIMVPSRPGEFHPEPLTDPDLTLSRHPARATE